MTCGAFSNGSPFVEPGTGGTFNTSILDTWATKQVLVLHATCLACFATCCDSAPAFHTAPAFLRLPQAAPFKAAGWDMSQVANIAIADEPGWSFPKESPEQYMNTSTSIYAGRQRAEWVAYLKQRQPGMLNTGGSVNQVYGSSK